MKLLEQLLSLISEAVLLPTLGAIVILVAWSAMLLGGLLREWLGRRHVIAILAELRLAHVEGGDQVRLLHILSTATTGLPARLHQLLAQWGGAGDLSHCLVDLEIEIAAVLSRLTWMTRIAPMLGLMGTLIPLGPALTGLASGDLATLSSNLVVAFTATRSSATPARIRLCSAASRAAAGCGAAIVNSLKNWPLKRLRIPRAASASAAAWASSTLRSASSRNPLLPICER